MPSRASCRAPEEGEENRRHLRDRRAGSRNTTARRVNTNTKIRGVAVFAIQGHPLLEDKELYLVKVAISLRTSRVRRPVASFLIRNPGVWFLLSDICHSTGKSTNQIIGALRGIVGEYEPKYSLLKLRIVQQKEIVTSPGKRQKLYKLADMTEETLDLIESILDKYKKEGEL
jgi:predicted transcriptional regulator with HTH domain